MFENIDALTSMQNIGNVQNSDSAISSELIHKPRSSCWYEIQPMTPNMGLVIQYSVGRSERLFASFV